MKLAAITLALLTLSYSVVCSAQTAPLEAEKVCVRVLVSGLERSSQEPNLTPYFVKVSTLRSVSEHKEKIFKAGRVTILRLHSPSQTFGMGIGEVRGKNFELTMERAPEGWRLRSAKPAPADCSSYR